MSSERAERYGCGAYAAASSADLRQTFTETIADRQSAGSLTDRVDPDTLSRLVQAVAAACSCSGCRIPAVDMAATVDAFFELLDPSPARDA